MSIRRSARWTLKSFRGKLAISIALSFVVLGVALVSVQLTILNQSLAESITISVETGTGDPVPTPADDASPIQESSECVATKSGRDCTTTFSDEASDYGQSVAGDVMRSYATWSIILLIAFTVIAAILAWVLTRSPARKISHITTLASDISEHDLSRRITLTGPRDEITALGDQIDTMLDRLEAAFTSQDLFVANASHELRTPITAIKAALEAPLTQGRVPDDLQPSLQRALRSAGRMDELITALLLVARRRHLDPHEREATDLGAIVTEATADIESAAHGRRLRINTDMPEEPVFIQGNSDALAIAIQNLLRNAIQHNHEDGWINLTLGTDTQCVVLTVSNSGPSYTQQDAAELTRAFNRGSHTRISGTPGTGLGLTIVDSIATAHDARLRVQPGSPDGLIVTLAFPAVSRKTSVETETKR